MERIPWGAAVCRTQLSLMNSPDMRSCETTLPSTWCVIFTREGFETIVIPFVDRGGVPPLKLVWQSYLSSGGESLQIWASNSRCAWF